MYLLFAKEEFKIINSLSEVSNLVHISVKSCTLLQLRANLVVRKHSVSALGDVNFVSDTLIVAFLSLEVVELLSKLCDKCILVTGLNAHGLVATGSSHAAHT